MTCDYSKSAAWQFIQSLSSTDIYKDFEAAENKINGVISSANAIQSGAGSIIEKAERSLNARKKDIEECESKIKALESEQKNTPIATPSPRIGLDGKPVTDKYGNVQQVFYNNPAFGELKQELDDLKQELESLKREMDWLSEAKQQASSLQSKYSTIALEASNSKQRLYDARSKLERKMREIEDLARKAMRAAEDALNVNIQSSTVVKYQCIPYLRKE